MAVDRPDAGGTPGAVAPSTEQPSPTEQGPPHDATSVQRTPSIGHTQLRHRSADDEEQRAAQHPATLPSMLPGLRSEPRRPAAAVCKPEGDGGATTAPGPARKRSRRDVSQPPEAANRQGASGHHRSRHHGGGSNVPPAAMPDFILLAPPEKQDVISYAARRAAAASLPAAAPSKPLAEPAERPPPPPLLSSPPSPRHGDTLPPLPLLSSPPSPLHGDAPQPPPLLSSPPSPLHGDTPPSPRPPLPSSPPTPVCFDERLMQLPPHMQQYSSEVPLQQHAQQPAQHTATRAFTASPSSSDMQQSASDEGLASPLTPGEEAGRRALLRSIRPERSPPPPAPQRPADRPHQAPLQVRLGAALRQERQPGRSRDSLPPGSVAAAPASKAAGRAASRSPVPRRHSTYIAPDMSVVPVIFRNLALEYEERIVESLAQVCLPLVPVASRVKSLV